MKTKAETLTEKAEAWWNSLPVNPILSQEARRHIGLIKKIAMFAYRSGYVDAQNADTDVVNSFIDKLNEYREEGE